MLVACNGDEGIDMEDMPPSALGPASLFDEGVGGSSTSGGAGSQGSSSTSGAGGGPSCVADVSDASLDDDNASLDVETEFGGAPPPNNCAGQRITIYYTNANYVPAVDAAKNALDTACIAAGCAGGDYSTIGACRIPPGPWEAYGSYQPGNKAACRP